MAVLDHAEALVVEHEDGDREALGDGGRDLERGHREAAIAADRRDVAREHQGGVLQRLPTRELQLVGAQDQGVAAKLRDAHLEGDAGPGGG